MIGSKLREIDRAWFEVASELLINLAAGWFGAVIIAPNFLKMKYPFSLVVLTADLLAGIFCLVLAFRLRKSSKLTYAN